MAGRVARLLLVALLAAVGLSAATEAQQQDGAGAAGQAGEAAEASADVPTAIPQTRLLARGQETEALLGRVDQFAAPDAEVQQINAGLTAEAETLARKRAELDRLEERIVSERTLTDQRERWGRSEQRVLAWRDTLLTHLQQLIELNEYLQFELDTWTLTRDSLTGASLGDEVVAGIDDLISKLDEAMLRIAPRIEEATELMNRAGRRQEAITDALTEIASMQDQLRGRVWTRDAPALWATPAMGLGLVADEIGFAMSYWWSTATDWLGARYGLVVALGVIFGILLVGAFALRRLRSRWTDNPNLAGANFVLSRPFAIAALATLGASTFLLDPITGPVNDIFRMVAVFAVIRLASGLAGPVPRRTYLGLVALFALNILLGFVPDGSVLGRLIALLLAASGVWVLGNAVRTWPAPSHVLWNLARGAAMAGTGLLLLGGFANLLGWVTLGATLITGVITSSLAAFAWMLLVNGTAALLAVLHADEGVEPLRALQRRQEFNRAVLVPLIVVACYGWLTGVIRNLGLELPVSRLLADTSAASLMVGSLELSIGGVFGAIFILVVTSFIARVVRYVLAEEIFRRLNMRPGTKSTVVSLVNYAIIAIGVVMAATAAGFNTTQLTVLIGAMSVGIGFGLQAVVGNFVSGLILMFERPVAVGDQVEAGGFLGKITHIGIRASRVQTFDGSDVIIPNSELVTKQVRNWTLSDTKKRINIDLSVGLDSDPRQVIEIMNQAATEHDNVLDDPAPRTLMMGYGDSSINFRLQIWLRVEHAVATPSELHLTLIERLRAVGVEVPAVRRERHEGQGEKER